MEVIVLLAAGLLALAIISIKIRRLIKDPRQCESGGCRFCDSCSVSSCQENNSRDNYQKNGL